MGATSFYSACSAWRSGRRSRDRVYFAEMSAAHGWYSYQVLTPEYLYFEFSATAKSWYQSGMYGTSVAASRSACR